MPVPTSVVVSPDTVLLTAIGATQQFSAAVLDQRGDAIAGATVTWSTTIASVATIDGAGLVTATGVGGTPVQALIAGPTGPLVGSAGLSVTQIPAQLAKVSGDLQTDTVAGTLSAPVVVQLNDALGHGIPGVIVSFAVTQGGGSLAAAADTTDAFGRASVVWTIGAAVGPNTLTATVSGTGIAGNPAAFTAAGISSGSVPGVSKFAGDTQTGLVGFPVNVPPAVQLIDTSGSPIAGTSVSFAVTGGGGGISGANAVTDAFGVARVGSWSLTLGANTLTATVLDTAAILGNPATFTATGASAAYDIELRFLTAVSPSRRAAFTTAAGRWETLIFGDVPSQAVSAGACGGSLPVSDETVDDVVIFASIDSIDGPGGVLGQAGPCVVRPTGRFPVMGVMLFDSADVADLESAEELGFVILHEMGHVLGLGTRWGSLLVGSNGSDPHFVGVEALAAFDRVGGAGYSAGAKVPVENCCGSGTRNSHWRESVFDTELMTGFLNSGANPLSVTTTASMGDLGYRVNYAASDAFVLSLALRAGPSRVRPLGDDILRWPIAVVDEVGRVTQVIPPR
ncbi:MAG: leishmanolysin-related zinc metalloendopeptidase [Gemmatimonadales bacterium]